MRRRDERGGVLLFVAVLVAVLVAVSAFAVDLGMQRVARRDMQAVADVIALDLGRLVDGRTRAQIESPGPGDIRRRFDDVLAASIARNARSSVGASPDIDAYLVRSASIGSASAGGAPVQVGPDEVPDAVVVTARTVVQFGMARVMGFESGGAGRSAVASASPPSVCFSVGTTTLALDTSQSVLSPLLDEVLRVDLEAVGYSGIVSLKNAYVPLADLLVALDVGTVEELADTTVTIGDFLAATATAIRANDSTADVSALEAIHLGAPGLEFPLGDILSLATGGPAAGLSGEVNVLALLTAAVFAAGRDSDDEIHAASLGVGLSPGVQVSLKVIEPPQIACGAPSDIPAPKARSAQIRLRVDAPLSATAALGLTAGGIHDLTIEVGSGEATLADLSCTPESATFDVWTGAVSVPAPPSGGGQVDLTVKLGQAIPGIGFILGLLGLDKVGLGVAVGATVASSGPHRASVPYPGAPAMPAPYEVSGGGSVLHLAIPPGGVHLITGDSGLLTTLAQALNWTLDVLLTQLVVPVVNGVVDPLLTSILTPVLHALGIRLGITELDMLSRPKCSAVHLIG